MSKKSRLIRTAYPYLEEADQSLFQYAEAIYDIKPHWLNDGKISSYNKTPFLEIEFISSHKPDKKRLQLIFDHRITVYFLARHVHFYASDVERKNNTLRITEPLKRAISYTQDVFQENLVFGYIRGSDSTEFSTIFEFPPSEIEHYFETGKIDTVVSWLGNYDQTR